MNYFDFNLSSYKGGENQNIEAGFTYSLVGYSPDDFIVKPVLENGLLEIFNQSIGKWVKANSPWIEFPKLDSEIQIKIVSAPFYKSNLYFEVFNTKNSEVYKTKSIEVWGNKANESYLSTLNRNLLDSQTIELEITKVSEPIHLSGETPKETNETTWLIFNLGVFTCAMVIGFVLLGDKIKKWKEQKNGSRQLW